MRSTTGGRGDLDTLRRQLQRWRQRHGGPGKRIPEALWEQAASVARREGVAEVARALRLDARQLEQRGAGSPPALESLSDASGAFVELGVAEVGAPRSSVEVTNAAGEVLRIEVAERVDVAALVQAFRARG